MTTLPDGLWGRMLGKRVVLPSTGCWLWIGSQATAKNPKLRYGEVRVRGKLHRVHRVSAALHKGFDLSSRVCVLHTCDTPLCFNPGHLFYGTRAVNNADKTAKNRQAKGRAVNRGHLTDADVRRMFRLRAEGLGPRKLGRKFRVDHGEVSRILSGKRWRHIWEEFNGGVRG